MNIVINNITLDKEIILELISESQLAAIKYVRAKTDLGLKESKDIVDNLKANPEYYDGKPHTIAFEVPDMDKDIQNIKKQSSNGMLYSKPNQVKKYVLIILAICLVAALYLFLNQ
ncbi:ribosomal protein L7/L12 [Olleya sp. 1-3]|uniref:ribosomal protein L7/L12 n=1 Tax=Olleya sp. 1-3 TaxID=2058323 RepID=UPI000C344B4B|nr:ribosomal protein L7/L12 [Olleya sp. 1-3]PKG51796.1 hypothetical protein CXF54_07300 [Olleya sp. 1-3]